MAKYIISLDTDDINVSQCGLHYAITTKDGIMINFTPAAFDELRNDINLLRPTQSPLGQTDDIQFMVKFNNGIKIFNSLKEVHRFLENEDESTFEDFVDLLIDLGEADNKKDISYNDWYYHLGVEVNKIIK